MGTENTVNSEDIKGLNYKEAHLLSRFTSSFIFRGTFCGLPVAVKRIQLVEINSKKSNTRKWKEKEILLRQLVHPNIIGLIHVKDEPGFRLFALNLCSASIDQLFLPVGDPQKFSGPKPPHRQSLIDISQGLEYLHSSGYTVCCLQPKNVLICETGKVHMKISSWCVQKSPIKHFSLMITQGRSNGFLEWIAPEFIKLLLEDKKVDLVGTVEGDIFVAGCIFFYLVSGGIHPFGNTLTTAGNIAEGNPVNMTKLDNNHFTYHLIKRMIRHTSWKRIQLRSVIELLSNPGMKFVQTLQEIGFKKYGPLAPAKLERKRKFDQMSGQSSNQSTIETVESNSLSLVPVGIVKSPMMCFHPFKPQLACYIGSALPDCVALWNGPNYSSPFSTWTQSKKLHFHKLFRINSVSCLEWSADGTKLAAGFDCGSIIIWNHEGDVIFQSCEGRSFDIPFSSCAVFAILWNPFNPGIVLFQSEFVVTLIDLKENLLLRRPFKKNNGAGANRNSKNIKWISIDTMAICYSKLSSIEIWKVGQVNPIQILNKGVKGKYPGFKTLGWNGVLNFLVSCQEQHIKVWLKGEDDPIVDLFPHDCCCVDFFVPAADLEKPQHLVACGLVTGGILVFRSKQERGIFQLLPVTELNELQSKTVDDLSFSTDGRFLAAVDMVGSVVIWTTDTWGRVYDLKWKSEPNNYVIEPKWLNYEKLIRPNRLIWCPTGSKLIVSRNPCDPFSTNPGWISLIEYLPEPDVEC